MNQSEFEAIKATFPWTERILPTGRGGLVQMIDRNGVEVPLFTITKLLMLLTQKMQPAPAPQQGQAA